MACPDPAPCQLFTQVSPEPSLVNVNVSAGVGADELAEAGVHPKHLCEDGKAGGGGSKPHDPSDDAATVSWGAGLRGRATQGNG